MLGLGEQGVSTREDSLSYSGDIETTLQPILQFFPPITSFIHPYFVIVNRHITRRTQT